MISEYFAQIKATVDRFAVTPFVLDASVTFDIRPGAQGYVAGSMVFADSSSVHFREFVDAGQGAIERLAYSYHYQDGQERLVFRYDNARHRPSLKFREHKHTAAGLIIEAPAPQLGDVLEEIALLRGWV